MTPTKQTELDFLFRVATNTKEPASVRLDAIEPLTQEYWRMTFFYMSPMPEQRLEEQRASIERRERSKILANVLVEIRSDERGIIADRVRASQALINWVLRALAEQK